MTREVVLGVAQLGPNGRRQPRAEVVERMLVLLRQGAERGCDLVAFPELALTTFFPRWYIEDEDELNFYYETEMPGPETKPLFDEALRLGVGFGLGYAELTRDGNRYNSYVLVERDGSTVANFRKVHIPGHAEHEPWRRFQHLERRYFKSGPEGFGVWNAFGGVVGMAICNDRRWSETYRVMGLQGVELILIGYNTPLYYAPDPTQSPLGAFHNHLVMQAGAYQNGTWVAGIAKGGCEEGVDSLSQSAVYAPSGQIVAQAVTDGDELIVACCDLDMCDDYKSTLFNFALYREPQHYSLIAAPKAAAASAAAAAAAEQAGGSP